MQAAASKDYPFADLIREGLETKRSNGRGQHGRKQETTKQKKNIQRE